LAMKALLLLAAPRQSLTNMWGELATVDSRTGNLSGVVMCACFAKCLDAVNKNIFLQS